MKKAIIVLFAMALLAAPAFADCVGDCSSDKGICISYCQGDGQCIARCADQFHRCVSRCR
ncbi:MAG: hypothetical protein WC952_13320 [Desulfobulbaceae bacterium]|jgi:hypothetical protein